MSPASQDRGSWAAGDLAQILRLLSENPRGLAELLAGIKKVLNDDGRGDRPQAPFQISGPLGLR